jgi:ribosomal protein S18 acetylase RimI-like enzyme
MRSEDLPRVARLCGELGYPVGEGELASRFEDMAGSGGEALFVAEASGRVVGWIHVGEVRGLLHEPEARVHGLVVDQDERGRGIGRLLLRQAEAWSVERGLLRVRLNSRVTREEAHRFYEGCGYERTKTQHVFARDLSR